MKQAKERWDWLLKTATERPLTDEECEEMHAMHRRYNAPFFDKDSGVETVH
jgi:hypothetical protein